MAARSGYYGSLAELAAVYAHGIAKNHPFVDRNKRAALSAAGMFLNAHGFDLQLGTPWVKHMERSGGVTHAHDRLAEGQGSGVGPEKLRFESFIVGPFAHTHRG